MDFADRVKAFASRIPMLSENVHTEEATKNALVMPLINILGYNVFDPTEVVPEYIADHGIKKGEKVDYAIIRDGEPSIVIECKNIGAYLNEDQASQLYRYFSVTAAKVGVLTNGIVYRFYSDLDSPNRMDRKPFLEIDMLDLKDPLITELKRFTKESFDSDGITDVAYDLKYTREIKQILTRELAAPSDEFVRFFAKQVYAGSLNKNAREKFSSITKDALTQFIKEEINERLESAMVEYERPPQDSPGDGGSGGSGEVPEGDGIVTTVVELEGYYIVKAILHEIIDPSRVVMKDTRSYCSIILDGNTWKPICRLRFDTRQKYLVLFDENKERDKIPIDDLNEIYNHSDKLKTTVQNYDRVKN